MLKPAVSTKDAKAPRLISVAAESNLFDTGFPLVEQITQDDHAQVLSPSKYIAIMKLDLATFAENAHVHRNTVGRAPAAQSIQKHLRENLRLIDSYEAGHGG